MSDFIKGFKLSYNSPCGEPCAPVKALQLLWYGFNPRAWSVPINAHQKGLLIGLACRYMTGKRVRSNRH